MTNIEFKRQLKLLTDKITDPVFLKEIHNLVKEEQNRDVVLECAEIYAMSEDEFMNAWLDEDNTNAI